MDEVLNLRKALAYFATLRTAATIRGAAGNAVMSARTSGKG